MINWKRKDASEAIKGVWLPPLGDGDEIASGGFSATVIDGTVTLSSIVATAMEASVRVAGGANGELVLIRLTVTTTEGETLEETAKLEIRSSDYLEPVTADDLRAHLRDVDDSDAILMDLITAAREYFEEATGLITVIRTKTLSLDAWPSGKFPSDEWWDGVRDGSILAGAPRYVELPGAPLVSITAVTVFASDGSSSTYPAASYFTDTNIKPGRMILNVGAQVPTPTRNGAGILIEYECGYEVSAIPASYRLAILQLAAHWYENRELVDLEGPSKVPLQAERIISKFRIVKL